MSKFKDAVSQEEIISKYFSDPQKRITLEPGEVLLNQYEPNDKLFYINEGKICAFLPDRDLREPVFEANTNSFIGVYSYFSDDSKSYSKLVAETHAVVSYYNDDPFDLPGDERLEFMTYLFEVVVEELRHRQLFAGNMAHERQETLKKLIHSEKMATLGQMAAGIAHELNNAIGSMASNLSQFQDKISEYLEGNENKDLVHYFNDGLVKGQLLSSSEARKTRQQLEQLDFLDKSTIKTFSRAGIGKSKVQSQFGHRADLAQKAAFLWELGYLLHDMEIAATHSTNVIQSVKSAAVTSQKWTKNANINKTVEQALAIVRTIIKGIEIETNLEDSLPGTEVCTGEIIQVWINLIKNAAESLINSETSLPKITIRTKSDDVYIKVSVSDNGPGIPKDLYEKVFHPNFTTKVGGLSFGLGLGLTIVQRIIDEHNGKIQLSSKFGSTKFDILLPIVSGQ